MIKRRCQRKNSRRPPYILVPLALYRESETADKQKIEHAESQAKHEPKVILAASIYYGKAELGDDKDATEEARMGMTRQYGSTTYHTQPEPPLQPSLQVGHAWTQPNPVAMPTIMTAAPRAPWQASIRRHSLLEQSRGAVMTVTNVLPSPTTVMLLLLLLPVVFFGTLGSVAR